MLTALYWEIGTSSATSGGPGSISSGVAGFTSNGRRLTPISGAAILSSHLDEIVASTERMNSRWWPTSLSALNKLPNGAGMYCVILPMTMLPENKTVILHGRTSDKRGARRQLQFASKYQAMPFRKGGGIVIYIGKASGLRGNSKEYCRDMRSSITTM